MSIEKMLENTISGLSANITSDSGASFMRDRIMPNLLRKINSSPIVTDAAKMKLAAHFGKPSTMPIQRGGWNISRASALEILQNTMESYLANLNKFDFQLVNLVTNLGLNEADLLVLLMINNINDLKEFCARHNIRGDTAYSIVQLKKMSEMHRLEYNFN